MQVNGSELASIEGAEWGKRGSRLLPESLIPVLGEKHLPNWVVGDLGLEVGSEARLLNSFTWDNGMTELPPRVTNYIIALILSNKRRLTDVRVVDKVWPLGFTQEWIPWQNRTRNSLIENGLAQDEGRLAKITYGELFRTPGIGVRTILDFATALDAALTHAAESGDTDTTLTRVTESESVDTIADLSDSSDTILGAEDVSEPDDELYFEFLSDALEGTWSAQISQRDPRLASILHFTDCTIFELVDLLTSPIKDMTTAMIRNELTSAIPELDHKMAEIQRMSLEDCLSDFLGALSGYEGARLDALLKRLGLTGEKPLTLAATGELLGVTRERIRQIEKRTKQGLYNLHHPVYMPTLDQAIDVLEANVPCTLTEAAAELHRVGITRAPFSPISVIEAAKLLGREIDLIVQGTKGRKFLNSSEDPRARKIYRIACSQANASGAANVGDVASELNEIGMAVSAEEVRKTLRVFSDVEFLHSAASTKGNVGGEDWFWVASTPPKRQRLRNIARKILSVTPVIELQSLRDGVHRYYGYRESGLPNRRPLQVPPIKVLERLFSLHPEFEVSDGMVQCTEALDVNEELGDSERIMLSAFHTSSTRLLDRRTLAQYCLANGMNESTFNSYVTYSPFIEHVDLDVWALRGRNIDPAAVEALRQTNALRTTERRIRDFGWTEDGNVWMAVKLPELTRHLVVGVPADIRRYVSGRSFRARSEDGKVNVTITVSESGSSWGYGSFLARAGADEEDYLVVEFNSGDGSALLKLGGVELFERYAD